MYLFKIAMGRNFCVPSVYITNKMLFLRNIFKICMSIILCKFVLSIILTDQCELCFVLFFGRFIFGRKFEDHGSVTGHQAEQKYTQKNQQSGSVANSMHHQPNCLWKEGGCGPEVGD